MLPLPCMLVCSFCLRKSHARPRVQQAPGLPCALYFEEGRTRMQTSGEMCREKAKARSAVIACAGAVARMSAATFGDHSNTAPDIASLIRATSNKLDCFASLAMTEKGAALRVLSPYPEEAAGAAVSKGTGPPAGLPRSRAWNPHPGPLNRPACLDLRQPDSPLVT